VIDRHLYVRPILYILSIKEVSRRTSLSKATVYKRIRAGEFPRPAKLTAGRVGWRSTDIDAWIGKKTVSASMGTWDTEIVQREFASSDDLVMEFLRMTAAAAVRKQLAREAEKGAGDV